MGCAAIRCCPNLRTMLTPERLVRSGLVFAAAAGVDVAAETQHLLAALLLLVATASFFAASCLGARRG